MSARSDGIPRSVRWSGDGERIAVLTAVGEVRQRISMRRIDGAMTHKVRDVPDALS